MVMVVKKVVFEEIKRFAYHCVVVEENVDGSGGAYGSENTREFSACT